MNLFSLLKVRLHMPVQDTDRNLSEECFLCIQMEAATQTGWDTDRKGIRHGLIDPRTSIHSPLSCPDHIPSRATPSDGVRRSRVSASTLLCSSEEKL